LKGRVKNQNQNEALYHFNAYVGRGCSIRNFGQWRRDRYSGRDYVGTDVVRLVVEGLRRRACRHFNVLDGIQQQGGEMKLTDAQKKYEDEFLEELAECKTMAEVRELIGETWSPDDIFEDYDLQRWAVRYADNHVDH